MYISLQYCILLTQSTSALKSVKNKNKLSNLDHFNTTKS